MAMKPSSPESRRQLRIGFIGDSFVNGIGDPHCLGWVGRLCAHAWQQGVDVTCYNLGIRRDTSAAIARRWQPEIAVRLPPEYAGRLVFSFGVNDTTIEAGTLRVPFEQSLAHATAMLSTAQQLWPTIMIGPPPVPDDDHNERIAVLSQALAQCCERLAVPYLDTFNPLRHSDIWLAEASQNDGFHPAAEGYAMLATIIQQWPGWLAWLRTV